MVKVLEWEYKGFKCLIIKHDRLGHLCGYVAVPKDHPYWGKDWNEADIDVHGGVTFSSQGDDIGNAPWKGKDSWWFGFDCAHAGDKVPNIPRSHPDYQSLVGEHEWTVEEVKRETEQMVEQFAKATRVKEKPKPKRRKISLREIRKLEKELLG